MPDEEVPKKFTDAYEQELDRIIRQIVTVERSNYLENAESARSIASEVKKIVENNIDRLER